MSHECTSVQQFCRTTMEDRYQGQNVATLSDTFVTFAMASFNIMSRCMHCVFLQGYNLYAIVHWLSFRHMSGYQSITKEAIFWSTFFSIEEAFEFC